MRTLASLLGLVVLVSFFALCAVFKQPEMIATLQDSPFRSQLLAALRGDAASQDALMLLWQEPPLPVADTSSKKILCQTYLSATILLAACPESILAVCDGLSTRPDLYCPARLSQVPLSADRSQAEAIALAKPDLAFVAPYSNPATVLALQRQGICLRNLPCPDSISGILETLTTVGQESGCPLATERLALFTDAALRYVDRLAAEHPPAVLRPLYISQRGHTQATPLPQSLQWQLIKRLQKPCLAEDALNGFQNWEIPLSHEEIAQLRPDCILLATEPMTKKSSAYDCKTIAIDEAVQQSPSQLIALAYYDLYQAMRQVSL